MTLLPCAAQVRPHLQCCVQLCSPNAVRMWSCWGESRGGNRETEGCSPSALEPGCVFSLEKTLRRPSPAASCT